MNEILINLENIDFSYDDGEKVLNNANLTVKKKEKLSLIGSNGSGKSTLLRILAALYFPKRGNYFFEGKKVNKKFVKELRKKIGILFQNPDSMIFNPTVYDEIAFSLKEFGFSDIDDRVNDIAKKFNIEKFLKKSPINLSGGEKQKVMLASILVYEPEILLLDEPTSAMDPRTTGWFIDFLLEIDKTVVLATHDLSVAYETTDRAVVMSEEHKIIYDGDMEELMKDLDILLKANLIHKHKHKHKNFLHSHYHLHF